MSVLVLVEFQVKPEHVDNVLNFVRTILPDTRGFDGCDGVTMQRNQDDANTMLFVEHWDSRQHYEKYVAWRTEKGDLDTLVGWIEGAPNIRYFDNAGV